MVSFGLIRISRHRNTKRLVNLRQLCSSGAQFACGFAQRRGISGQRLIVGQGGFTTVGLIKMIDLAKTQPLRLRAARAQHRLSPLPGRQSLVKRASVAGCNALLASSRALRFLCSAGPSTGRQKINWEKHDDKRN